MWSLTGSSNTQELQNDLRFDLYFTFGQSATWQNTFSLIFLNQLWLEFVSSYQTRSNLPWNILCRQAISWSCTFVVVFIFNKMKSSNLILSGKLITCVFLMWGEKLLINAFQIKCIHHLKESQHSRLIYLQKLKIVCFFGNLFSIIQFQLVFAFGVNLSKFKKKVK